MIKDIKVHNEGVRPSDRMTEILHADFPQCFTNEGKFDLEKFKTLLQDNVDLAEEGYGLNFLGKNYANLIASTETETVIQPDEEHNSLPENKNSENIYISGDNLDALKHLLKSYSGKIKCIYIDPPYNTGSDGFVYNDKFNFTVEQIQDKLSISEEKAKRILDLCKRGSASHSAWLMFMAPRLMLARDLLTEDGVIFISIDDNEQANLKLLCDSVFGEENFVATFPWRKRTAKSDVPFGVSQDYEWISCYAKTNLSKARIEGKGRKYFETDDFPNKPWRFHDMSTQRTAQERPNSDFTIINPKNGKEYPVNKQAVWRVTKNGFPEYLKQNRIIFPGDYDFLNITNPVLRYWKEDDEIKAGENFGKIAVSTFLPKEVGMSQDGTNDIDYLFSQKVFSYPKPTTLLKFIFSTITSNGDAILDFFSGSGSSAHAVMKLNIEDGGNRKYIMVQLPEPIAKDKDAYTAGYRTIDEIGQERIRRAAKKLKEENPDYQGDLGFKHYTLREVSQNTLDKMDTFNPQWISGDKSILDSFGKKTVLETWLVKDGYGLGANVEELKLGGYQAYHHNSHLYLIEGENFDEKAIIALVDKYVQDCAFNPQNIVLFGYSFTYSQTEMIKKNLATLKDSAKNLSINIDIRY
ncbi:MAG: site-specific DNA-methyltransferase [Paludibacteraceae bacterium]|nr:site-specific DNA-methyltransferase [Paludibacteraceae bacterium]